MAWNLRITILFHFWALLQLNEMTVQFNDMIATIKRNENGFVIILEYKTAICNDKVTEINGKYYNVVTI